MNKAHSKSITKHEEELDATAKKKEKVHKTKEKVKAKERLTKTKKKANATPVFRWRLGTLVRLYMSGFA